MEVDKQRNTQQMQMQMRCLRCEVKSSNKQLQFESLSLSWLSRFPSKSQEMLSKVKALFSGGRIVGKPAKDAGKVARPMSSSMLLALVAKKLRQ